MDAGVTDKLARLRLGAEPRFARNPAERPGRTSCTGWYQSIKLGDQLPYESLLERDALLLLDLDPDVARFTAQPETFVWTEGSRQRRYTPDVRLETTNGELAADLDRPINNNTVLMPGRHAWSAT